MIDDVTLESARVYRAGNRRFFSRLAAFTHVARLRIAVLRPCACEPHETDERGFAIYEGSTCDRHSRVEHWNAVTARYTRILMRAANRKKVKP